MKKFLNGGRTLGLFVTSAEDRYERTLLQGVFDAIRTKGGHLICFTSGALRSYHGFEAKRNILYDLVTPHTLDGLVISGALGHNIGVAEMQALCSRYHPMPIVSIALPMPGIPGLRANSLSGMRRIVDHLLDVHGKRRVAFIRGPLGQQEAEERYQAYCESLKAHGIRLNPKLIVNGDYTYDSGLRAAKMLLDQAGRGFDAVVAANDMMALGAIQVFSAQGINVPNDVAVTGFDDTDNGRYNQPPLTTVRQSPYEQGMRAAHMLFDMLADKAIPEQLLASAVPVIRQSCGCGPSGAGGAVLENATPPTEDLRKHLYEMIHTQSELLAANMPPGWIDQLLDAAFQTLNAPDAGAFLNTWQSLLNIEAIVGNETVWFGILDILQSALQPVNLAPTLRQQHADVWNQARLLINATNARQQAHRRIATEKQITELRNLSETMLTTFDMDSLLDVMAQELPKLGVSACFLSIYENPQAPANWSYLLLGYDSRGRRALPPGGLRFSSLELIPDAIGVAPGNGCLIVEALYAKSEQLGFVVLELPPEKAFISGTLRSLFSSALQGILLLQQRQKVEAELRTYQNTLEEMVASRTQALARANDLLKMEIAEREAAEQRLRQYSEIVDKMDVGMYVVQALDLNDPDSLTIVAANPAALRYSEKTAEQVLGKPLTSVLTTLKSKGFPETYLQVMKTGQPANLEDRYYTPSGSLQEAYTVKVFRLTSNSVGVLFENVTEQKLAEERLRQFNAELEARVEERTAQLAAVNRDLESFSYSVSHDLRAPLRAISGFSRILLEDFSQDLPEEIRSYLRRINEGAQHMSRLIDDLLAFSRLGRQEIRKSTVDMLSVAREVCDSLANEYAGRQVRFVFGLIPPAHADPAMVARIYANLIGNAIKYTRQREVAEIEIGCLRQSGPCIYYVKDNGAGFNMQYADKLFGVFQRLHRQDEFEGTGVGLATVKRIVERHGGKIWAEAEEGKGATFYFTLSSK